VQSTPKRLQVDFVTGKRQALGSTLLTNVQTIYNNDCTFGGQFYVGLASCEELYDEGRIPSQAPGSGSPVSWDAFTFAYCTYNASSFLCNIAFADNAGGPCLGGVAPTPPAWAASPTFTDLSLSGLGLPGSTATGSQACWIVTITNVGLCVQADGDGVFDNDPAKDLFTFGFRHHNVDQPGAPEGLVLAGEPLNGAPGSCSYNNPCGVPGALCGTGLGTEDSFWVNADGTPIGTSVPTNCPNGVAQYGYGTNCYWFGGYPANPFASVYFQMEGGRTCATCTAGVAYCTAGTSSSGCVLAMTSAGLPSNANPGGFTLTSINMEAGNNGLMFYGVSGPFSGPFQNGRLCVSSPLNRLSVKNAGGVGACTGTFGYTLAEIQSSGGAPVGVGTTVWVQTWQRDPALANGSTVSDAYEFTVCP
jgi:hypothetical protein